MYNSQIHIDAGSLLALEHCTIKAMQGNCKIVVDGNMTVLQQTSFIAESGASLEIVLNNQNNNFQLHGFYTNCQVTSYAAGLTLLGCQFLDCPPLQSYRGNVTVNNICTFDNTSLWLENDGSIANAEVKIENSSFIFTGPLTYGLTSCVYIDSYPKYTIFNNTIDNSLVDGIQISSSGNMINSVNKISKNTIINCDNSGILAYNSKGIIENNSIFNNKYGVCFLDNSHFALKGNADALQNSETQQILDNTSFEVYASNYCFPYEFNYNVVIDNDNAGNPTDPMVYYNTKPVVYYGDQPTVPPGPSLNVKNNCWGASFNPSADFKTTTGYFVYNPMWCPGGKDMLVSPDEELYFNALLQVENGNYFQAKELFQYLIHNYRSSFYAQASIKDLFFIEQQLTNDYGGLREYYLTNDSISADTLLMQLADVFANQCNIKLSNWSDAINWYENRILNPPSMEDSIFAIIDLGYLYFLMENSGLKSAYIGNLKQYIPASRPLYNTYRSYLLSLLPADSQGKSPQKAIADFRDGCLLQNAPNPFCESSEIWYKIEKEADVKLSISDMAGKEVMQIQEGRRIPGIYNFKLSGSQLSPGTYLYSIIINGIRRDTKRMIRLP